MQFFLVDFCYFALLAACAFFVLAPEDPRLEAAVYALCEGPLAGALVAWQCAWLLGSPDHAISVLVHMLPGLALFCHRFLTHTRRPVGLLRDLAAALATGEHASLQQQRTALGQPSGAAAWLSWGVGARLRAAAAVAQGQVPCLSVTHGGSAEAGLGLRCFAPALPALSCPSPAWLWLLAAPLAFYLAWQLLYYLVVQVVFLRLVVAGGYDTSYRALARRAQRAGGGRGNALHRLVRTGGVARRLFMFGLLQLAFTLVTLVVGVGTYLSFPAAVAWQVVKFALPLYLGARHQCERLPVQQLRAAAARLVAEGLMDAAVLGQGKPQPVVSAVAAAEGGEAAGAAAGGGHGAGAGAAGGKKGGGGQGAKQAGAGGGGAGIPRAGDADQTRGARRRTVVPDAVRAD